MNVTLIGALRRLDHIRLRSDFYRSWEVALRTFKNIPESLAQMEASRLPALEAARQHLLDGIAKGRPLAVSVKLRPDLFPAIDQLLLGAGEGYGTLGDSLRLLSEYHLNDFNRLARVRGWLGTPIALGVVAAFVIPYPLLWDRGTPYYSAAIIAWVVAMYSFGGIPVSLVYSLAQRMESIRRARFAWTLAVGLEGGLTFAGAARLAATMGDFPRIGAHLDSIPGKTLKTMSLTHMLETSGVWPAMLAQVKQADAASEYLSTLRVFAANLESHS
ncbi:MAG: hypothetical protein FJ202_08495 [Gemmatimonadetes bacterium]|nr:hypothetical protein [Gemmatimonadota bacterium]